jgi:hypothetical protein
VSSFRAGSRRRRVRSPGEGTTTPADDGSTIQGLLKRVEAALGADRDLDRAIAAALDPGAAPAAVPDYTGSIPACLALFMARLPGWRWHLGWGPTGVLPYARATRGDTRIEAEAPTVPLALLAVLLGALLAG